MAADEHAEHENADMGEIVERLTAMMTIVEQLGMVIDATAAYRAKCIEQAFSDTAAEQMAVVFHNELLTLAFKQST